MWRHRLQHGAPYATVEEFARWLASWNAHKAKLRGEHAETERIRKRGDARKRRVMRVGSNALDKRREWYWQHVETEPARTEEQAQTRRAQTGVRGIVGRAMAALHGVATRDLSFPNVGEQYFGMIARLLPLAVCAALMLSICPASARIGESPQQCNARYGNPTSASTPEMNVYLVNGYIITCHFYSGQCDAILFQKGKSRGEMRPDELSAVEIATLLRANGGIQQWKEVEGGFGEQKWMTGDSQIGASYFSLTERMLVITTRGYGDRANAEKAAEQAKALKGF